MYSLSLVLVRSRLNQVVNMYLILDILSVSCVISVKLSALILCLNFCFLGGKNRLCVFIFILMKCTNISVWVVLFDIFLNSVTWCQCCLTLHLLGGRSIPVVYIR